MPYRNVSIIADHFYHIYNRGNNRQPIFLERENYRFFLRKFTKYFPSDRVEIHAFCLMPNHYHMLVRLLSDFDYSKQMQSFSISYAKSVNLWNKRTGHLFQGRFQVRLVESTEYLLHLSRYIHLNPRFARLVKQAEDWEFSSYQDYLFGGKIPEITEARQSEISGISRRPAVTTELILSHFGGVEDYREFVESFADERMKQIEDELWK